MSISEIKFTIADILKTPLQNLHYNTHLEKDLGLDLLDIAELTVEIENRLAIRMADDQIAQLTTVKDLIAEVESAPRYIADEAA